MTHPAFPIVTCACTTWAAYGMRDRDRRTGHHVECRAGRDDPSGGPYRTAAPRARAAGIDAERAEERAAVARRLAAGHWVKQDGTPTTDGDECASFREGDCRMRLSRPTTGSALWDSGYRARWDGWGLGACRDTAPASRAAWIDGWRWADAERAREKK